MHDTRHFTLEVRPLLFIALSQYLLILCLDGFTTVLLTMMVRAEIKKSYLQVRASTGYGPKEVNKMGYLVRESTSL